MGATDINVIIMQNKMFYYYDKYENKDKAIEIANMKKKEVKGCSSYILKTVKGYWSSTPIYLLYLTKIAPLRMG